MALSSLEYPPALLEVLVVDDGSTDSTPAIATTFPRIRFVRQPNRGVSAARNHGAQLAIGEILIFFDDDIAVSTDNIRRHLAARELYAECVVAGHSEFDRRLREQLLSSPLGRFRVWCEDVVQSCEAERWGTRGRVEVPTVDTQNMSIARSLFWRIGGFDERFPVGAEDQDLCWRARSAGAVVVRDHDIRVIHNDQHRDLVSLCHREERGAIGIVYMTRKHPDFPTPASLELNGPLRLTDPPRLATRKLVRSAMTRPIALAAAHRLIHAVETVRPRGGWPLEYLYRAITGLYVFRGTRQGMRLTRGQTLRRAHKTQSP
jgi:GT2 family glycosyltransferase